MLGSSLRAQRILDIDIETRKIGFHIGGQWNPDGCEPIAISWSCGDGRVEVRQLGVDDPVQMLSDFRAVYVAADIVTGHYIRKFDLPILNGSLIERGLEILPAKLAQDTKGDLVARGGMSASQENLAALFKLLEDKYHMSDTRWREATRLTPEGIEHTRRRVMDDVRQHIQLRAELLRRGLLRSPRIWRP